MKKFDAPETQTMQTNVQTAGTAPPKNRRAELSVDGMTCNGCARHVTAAIQGVPGIESATVSLDDRSALVRWKAGAAPDVPTVVRAIEKAGFKAREIAPVAGDAPSATRRESVWSSSAFLGVIPTALLMAGESTHRFFSPLPIHFNQAIGVAVVGLVVNLVCALLLKDDPHHHHHHHNDHPHEHGQDETHEETEAGGEKTARGGSPDQGFDGQGRARDECAGPRALGG